MSPERSPLEAFLRMCAWLFAVACIGLAGLAALAWFAIYTVSKIPL